MNTVQRIAKNTGVLLASQVVSYVFGFFYVMYTARYLGAEGFGVLSFALAFTGIFGVFSDLGVSTLTVREVARDKSLAGKYLGNIVVMKVILVAITFGLIALTINLLGYPEQTIKVVYLVALYIIFGAFSNIFNSIFQAYEKMNINL
jgi:Polysaccharide biosynthesis protein.